MLHRNWICISSRLRDIEPETYWGHNARYIIDHVTIRFPICCILLVFYWNLSPSVRKLFDSKYIWVTTTTFQGHVTSSVTWRFDSPYGVSYWCSIGTKYLSPSIFEIFRSKYIGVTTLTFWGHVTSLVMWPFDAQYRVSYWRSIVTDSLFPAVFEILGPEHIGVTTLNFLMTTW